MAAEVQHSSRIKAIVREEFTRPADAYAAAAVITSEARLERLIAAIRPDRERARSKSRPARATSQWRSQSIAGKCWESTSPKRRCESPSARAPPAGLTTCASGRVTPKLCPIPNSIS